jgi:hypothetical protein
MSPFRSAGVFRPGMRAYFFPLGAGIVLAASAFLPWVVVGDTSLKGFPDTTALWVLGLGVAAVVLSMLSLITRKNSRHPLLLVGLVAFGALFLAWRIMPRTVGERVQTASQAMAIVENTPVNAAPDALAGSGIYLGLAAATVLVLFGLTIVVKRASAPYAVAEPDDDV